jgi:hypothetical protein
MIKTIWVSAQFQRKGRWEEYKAATGEVKKGFFGAKPVMATKKRWVELDEYSDTQIDGAKLSRDIQRVLVELESKGFDLVAITPVLSGQYGYADYSGGGIGTASTCASWGFSVTSGVTVTARKVPKSA